MTGCSRQSRTCNIRHIWNQKERRKSESRHRSLTPRMLSYTGKKLDQPVQPYPRLWCNRRRMLQGLPTHTLQQPRARSKKREEQGKSSISCTACPPWRNQGCKKMAFCGWVAICPRDARPNRSTPGLSRPCDVDAGVRVCRPRRCLHFARRFSAGSARFDAPTLLRSRPRAPSCEAFS